MKLELAPFSLIRSTVCLYNFEYNCIFVVDRTTLEANSRINERQEFVGGIRTNTHICISSLIIQFYKVNKDNIKYVQVTPFL